MHVRRRLKDHRFDGMDRVYGDDKVSVMCSAAIEVSRIRQSSLLTCSAVVGLMCSAVS